MNDYSMRYHKQILNYIIQIFNILNFMAGAILWVSKAMKGWSPIIAGLSAVLWAAALAAGTFSTTDGTFSGDVTSATGTLSPADVMRLTGLSTTSSVGSLSIRLDPIVSLEGLSATSSVALFGTSSGFGIQAYSDVDTGSNSSYTSVATGSNTSYTDAA